ncbi:hypothetical protein [Actinoplanes couchii]|nr:hypothetical protein [Actinoplanes couchii]MDR6318791.1 2-polyprenyl-6-methoxyphenol hydroxylase-like FAD-dependent oxidoreductase [Actinoplanes couchii]
MAIPRGIAGLAAALRLTRTAVFGPDHRVDLPFVVAAFPLTIPDSAVPPSSATTYIGPGRTAAMVHLGPHRSAAFFTYRCGAPDRELERGAADALGAAFGDLGAGVPEAIAHLRSGPAEVYFDRVSQVALPRWSSGRVVLLGDAAWCVTLFAGHGAALALAGADQLGAALHKHGADRLGDALHKHGDDIPAALPRWEAGLRPEVVKRQALAHRGMHQYAPPSRFHVWMNDLTIRAITLPGIRDLVRRGIERQNR